MIKPLALAGMMLAALPASAQAVGQRAAALLDIIIANDCAMSKDQAAESLPPLGFQRRETLRLSRELKAAGMISVVDDVLTVNEEFCPAATEQARPLMPFQEQYISILRHNGCQLMTGESTSLFPKYGMEAGLASELEEGLVDRGIAEISGGALHVGPAYCIADEAFASLPLLDLSVDEVHLVELLEIGNCSLVQSEIELTFPRDGMPADAAKAAVASLLASGAALAVEGGDRIWLSPAFCQPWSERKN